ncbi:hypothetical protein SETIT_3G316600v2 [Setaria italica]|uniref:Uncharacterized protein n=1 Tax=Setaria italica TaxID=4555 RepID=A0A368QLD1_SETIT|nr:hypothetical protein SETIT_3G316600v2 [Setaria italica]
MPPRSGCWRWLSSSVALQRVDWEVNQDIHRRRRPDRALPTTATDGSRAAYLHLQLDRVLPTSAAAPWGPHVGAFGSSMDPSSAAEVAARPTQRSCPITLAWRDGRARSVLVRVRFGIGRPEAARRWAARGGSAWRCTEAADGGWGRCGRGEEARSPSGRHAPLGLTPVVEAAGAAAIPAPTPAPAVEAAGATTSAAAPVVEVVSMATSGAGGRPAQAPWRRQTFLGAARIYAASVLILHGPHQPLFARVAATFVLPLSTLFLLHITISHALSTLSLLHIAISHALFTHINTDDTTLDSSASGTDAQRHLLSRLASDWLALLLFKAAYLLTLLLLLSLLATTASVYSAKHDALTFLRVLSVVPRVWRRLVTTFLAAFALHFMYYAVLVVVFLELLVTADNGSGLAGLLAFLLLIACLVGLIYISVVWYLASVISVLEDYKGLATMRKSRDLIRGTSLQKS